MKYYAVSDVHGHLKELKAALVEAGFFRERGPCKLVMCGDLLDRGKEARALVEFMLELMRENKLIYVLGNHEELLLRCMQDVARGELYDIACGSSYHCHNGTWDTMLQLAKMTEEEGFSNPNELVLRVKESRLYKELLTICVDYYETPHYVFVHGWIPCHVEGYSPYYNCRPHRGWRGADAEAWRRARWYNGMDLATRHHITVAGKTVVCGHMHSSYGHSRIEGKCPEWGLAADHSPFYADGIIAIDGATASSGMVNCIVIDD